MQAEPIPNLQNVRVTIAAERGTTTDTVDAFHLPWEKALLAHAGSDVSVDVDGLDLSGSILVHRRARVAMPLLPEDRLLRIRLENACASVTCAGQTCVGGSCVSDRVDGSTLEAYRSNWATDVPDICRPAGGAPQVIVGTGQTDYLPLSPNQVVQLEAGPQGGHHVWIALRQKNLHRSGSITTIAGTQPMTGLAVMPTSFVFTFDPDEGGYCKLYGLRFQVDAGGADYHPFLDKDLDVTVTVKDVSGDVASGTARVHIAPTLVGQ